MLFAETNARDILFELDLPEGAEELKLDSDPVRVEQILWNLLHNAFKFTPDGGRVCLRLRVEDTGQGIAPEYLDKVFDLFSQVPERRLQSNRRGLGIGLALVQQLAQAHGGRVEAFSAGLGKGSTFSVWLPLRGAAGSESRPTQPSGGRFEGLRVLVVDASAKLCELMQALLETEGAQVSVAYDGKQGLAAARQQQFDLVLFDLVLSDIGMPEMDGLAFVRALRQLPNHANTPRLALTGYGGSTDQHEALEAGFTGHLDKPVSFEALLQTIGTLLDR